MQNILCYNVEGPCFVKKKHQRNAFIIGIFIAVSLTNDQHEVTNMMKDTFLNVFECPYLCVLSGVWCRSFAYVFQMFLLYLIYTFLK